MRLFSYIVAHDTGLAPNPFWGYCTLSCCKPTIRRTANVGDYIVGLSSKSKGNKVIYAMEVKEILTISEYFRDERFTGKIPDYSKETVVHKCGDNFYEPLPNDSYRQLRSLHSDGDEEDLGNKQHDLGGKNVLISQNFVYFGSKAIDLPDRFAELKVGRSHKNRFSDELVSDFIQFVSAHEKGMHAPPSKWPQDDKSWKMETAG